MRALAIGLAALLAMPSVAWACSIRLNPALGPNLLLVGNKGEDTVSFVNLDEGKTVLSPSVSQSAPHEIAVSPGQALAAVVNYGGSAIDVISTLTGVRWTTVQLGENTRPHGIVWLSDDRIIATTEGNDSIVVLTPDHDFSGETISCATYDWTVDSIPTGQKGTHMVALSPDETVAYTANMGSGTVSRIDLSTKAVTSADAGRQVEGVAVTADGSELWASVRGEDIVIVFDAATLERLAVIPVGQFPLRIIASPDGRHMVTSNLLDGSLSVLDVATREVVRTIPVSGDAAARQVTILFSEDGTRLYVAETGTDTVAEVNFASGEVLRRIQVGKQGDGLAIVRWSNAK